VKTAIGYDAMPSSYKDGNSGTNLYMTVASNDITLQNLATDLGMSNWTGGSTITLDLDETVVDRVLQNSNVLGLSSMPLSWQQGTAGGSTVYDKLVALEARIVALEDSVFGPV
jgi:hypothetical protein